VKQRLGELARDAWDQHERAERAHLPHLVRPSIPILFFGDSERFADSPLRVITVGLNPSREEFPRAAPFRRFPGSEAMDGDDPMAYVASLNAYFRIDPYTTWFNPSFEPILRGLGASYYGAALSTALHTDLCSPLVTDPTWSRLARHEQTVLEPAGRRLWHDLVEVLQPDIVLISVGRQRLSKIAFPVAAPASVVHTVDGPARARSYCVEAFRHELPSGKTPLFVFGRASQTPFGSVSAPEKERIGARILELLNA
jgi:hypothetical protein